MDLNEADDQSKISAMTGKGPLKIIVELPPEAVDIDVRSVGELATDLRLLWIIDRVRAGRISVGKGAELAGMDRWSFMRTMGEHGVPVIAYSAEDLRKDVATLDSL
jgi:predicted HTH domain antitoxin